MVSIHVVSRSSHNIQIATNIIHILTFSLPCIKAVCSGGVQGLSWIFFTMLTIALSSMMMITFRAALYPIRGDSDALSKAGDAEIVHYQQHANEPQDREDHDLQLTESKDAMEEADTRKNDVLDADKAVQIY